MPEVRSTIGLIVNPIAGMGGRVALHGTDGDAILLARQRGAAPAARQRANRALARLRAALSSVTVVRAAEPMAADFQAGDGWASVEIAGHGRPDTTAADTRAAARAMLSAPVDLLLFAGGDGTAVDIVDVVGTNVPILGIPAGVKMHSGVFATTPEAAGEVAARFLRQPRGTASVRDVEVIDADPDQGQGGWLDSRSFGLASVPSVAGRLQGAKAGPPERADASLSALCRELAASMEPDRIYIFGPGTTTAQILRYAGLTGSVVGVDVVRGGKFLTIDATEERLLGLLEDGGPASLILSVVGGQGFLLGRGNQQISPAVISRVGVRNLTIVASADKLRALDPPILKVDLGDDVELERLYGYHSIRTGPRETTILRISS